MPEEFDSVEIETSTDTVEDVQAAMDAEVEVDESQPEVTGNPEPEAEAEEEPEEPEEQPEEEAEETEGKPVQAAPKVVSRRRLNEVIAQRNETRRQLEEANRKLAQRPAARESEKPTVAAPARTFSGKPEPTLDAFQTGIDPYDAPKMNKAVADYAKALQEWSREEGRAEAAANLQAQKQAETMNALNAGFLKNAKQAIADRLPDYDEVVGGAADIHIWPDVAVLAKESTVGPDIFYYLATNKDYARELDAMPEFRRASEIGRLEREIKRAIKAGTEFEETETERTVTPTRRPPAKRTVSRAPEPPSRLRPAGPGPRSMQDLAGPVDRTGIDIDFNPEYERAVKAGRTT